MSVTKESLERRLRVYEEPLSEVMSDEADTIRLALVGLAMQWQPIETAPKDQRILVLRPTPDGKIGVDTAKWYDDRFAKKEPKPCWESERHWFGLTGSRAFVPTHWMPLPEVP